MFVARADHDATRGGQAQVAGRAVGQGPGDLGRVRHPSEGVRFEAGDIEQPRRPVAGRDVVEHRRRRVGMVDDALTRQPGDEVGARQQVGRGPLGDRGLDLDDPGDLRRTVVGVEVEAGDRADLLGLDPVPDRVGLTGRAAIHPDDRGAQRTQVRIDGNDAIDLGRQADHPDVSRGEAGVGAQAPDDLGEGAFPVERVLLGPYVVRVQDRV